MAILQTVCDSYKAELAQALHNFTKDTGHQFAIALYTSLASLNQATTNYTSDGEVVGAGYTAGGFLWTPADNLTPLTNSNIAFWSFSRNPEWQNATITARGALLYNVTSGNRAVCIFDFGADKSSFNGTFSLALPGNSIGTSILRIE